MFCALAHSWRVRGMRLLNHATNKLFIRKFLQSSALNLILLENKHSYHLKGWHLSCQNSTWCCLSCRCNSPILTLQCEMWPSWHSLQIYRPQNVSLRLHNLKTARNLLVNQEDVYVPLLMRVQSCVPFVISYFVDKIKATNLSKKMTITFASSKSTIDYALPTPTKKNKRKEKEQKLHSPSCSWPHVEL